MSNTEVDTFVRNTMKTLNEARVASDRDLESRRAMNELCSRIRTTAEHILTAYPFTQEISDRPKTASHVIPITTSGDKTNHLFLLGYTEETGHAPKQFSTIQCRLLEGAHEHILFQVRPNQVTDYFEKPLSPEQLDGAHKTLLYMQAKLAEQEEEQRNGPMLDLALQQPGQ